jgi:TonB family protein
MRTRTQALIWTGVSVASLFVHVAAFGGLGAVRRDDGFGGKKQRPPTLVQMEVKPPPPPLEEAKPAAPKAPRLAVARPARVSAPRPATLPPPAEAPPPQAETPADFTGTTLTNTDPGSGPGWASATGNGEAMRGPVGTPGAKVTGRIVLGATGPAPRDPGPPVVGAGDLSRAPSAPDLASVLERFYPEEARKQGVAGKAVVRARIMSDGQVRELAVVSESTGGFGEACRQTLRGSRWTAPLDRDGQSVSTYVSYTCRFEVR